MKTTTAPSAPSESTPGYTPEATSGHTPEATHLLELAVADILPDPEQPRRHFDEKALQELAATIRKYGVLQPLTVKPAVGPGQAGRYTLVYGERRWRAAQLAGLTRVPVQVRTFSLVDGIVAQLVENVHRADLSDIEKAEALHRLRRNTDLQWDALADMLGLSLGYVKTLAGLIRLEEPVKELVRDGQLTGRVAIALKPLPGRMQVEMAERAAREGLTAEQIRGETARNLASRTRSTLPTAPEITFEPGEPVEPVKLVEPVENVAVVEPVPTPEPRPSLLAAAPPPRTLPERLTPAAPVAAPVEPVTAPVPGGGPIANTLRQYAEGIERIDRWINSRSWAPSRVSEPQEEAFLGLLGEVSQLQRTLVAIRQEWCRAREAEQSIEERAAQAGMDPDRLFSEMLKRYD